MELLTLRAVFGVKSTSKKYFLEVWSKTYETSKCLMSLETIIILISY